MHTIEQELIEVTGYKTQRKFANRQDYLGSILNAIMKLTDDDFNNLSDEAATWANAAVEAKNSKAEELPDFDEAVEPDDDGEATDDAEGGEEAEQELADDIDAGETGDEPADDEPEPEPVKVLKEKPKSKFKVPPKEEKASKPKATPKPPKQDDAVLDKWGAIEGSLNSKALAMFEKGSTMKEVKEELGGSTFYNILKRAVEQGHKLEKEGHIMTLVHKDGKKPQIKPPAKKKK